MCYFTFHCLSKFYAQLFGGGSRNTVWWFCDCDVAGPSGSGWRGKVGQNSDNSQAAFFWKILFFFFFFYIKHHKTLIAYNVNLLSRKCLPGTCMQTVFKVRHFYKALNQQRSHVLIERKRERRKKRRSKLCGASHRSHHISAPLCFFFFLLDKHWPLSGRWMEWEGTNCWTKGRCGRLMQETASFWAHKFVCLI